MQSALILIVNLNNRKLIENKNVLKMLGLILSMFVLPLFLYKVNLMYLTKVNTISPLQLDHIWPVSAQKH